MRIDYILTSPGVKPVSFHVVEKELSDHFPIVAEISFEN
jgi:endonuclease/exonuclease/phosphatase family metal-dependent hydrolase